MALDFERIKAIPISDVVVGHYRIPLKFNGAWGSAACPLPTHKPGEKDKTFAVNAERNYWLCHSDSCNEKSGGKKGGDCINFVALMERCSEYDAAKKLADWFHIESSNGSNGNNRAGIAQTAAQNKNGSHRESRPADASTRETSPQKDHPDHNPSRDTVKQTPRYMETIDKWFDELMQRGDQEDDAVYLKRVRNGVKAKLIESYRNGKRVAQGLAPE